MSEIEKRTENDIVPDGLYGQIREILEAARKRAHTAVNFSMVLAYWDIGRLIVEQQGGAERAEYGKGLIAELSAMLTADFGKGFDESNLAYMRRFYLSFPNLDALRPELSWTHYRKLTAVKNEAARAWYMNEAAEAQWSSRQLDRQISTLYYERMLASQDGRPVVEASCGEHGASASDEGSGE